MVPLKNQRYIPHVPRVRCPHFAECEAGLCPLQPFPSKVDPLRDEDLCLLYTRTDRLAHLDDVPWFLFAPLLDYARRLAEIGIIVEDHAKF